jgi:ketosteroid isomerase-like protein
MSEENVELVRDLLDAFRRRDHEYAFQFYDPDIEWDSSRMTEWIPDIAGVYHGHDGVRTYWRRWLSAWKDLDFDVEEVLDGGDEIVVLVRNQRQWGRHSGIETTMQPYALVFTVRDGMVTRWRNYPDQESGLKAAGLGAD